MVASSSLLVAQRPSRVCQALVASSKTPLAVS
jgi:hypothetical protein